MEVTLDKINVFVRKGVGDHERTLSFLRPERIPTVALFDYGMAIDGNQAMMSVVGTKDLGLPKALLKAELDLCRFLNEAGYAPDFK